MPSRSRLRGQWAGCRPNRKLDLRSLIVNATTTHPTASVNVTAAAIRLSPAAITTLAAVLVAVIAWFDYATGDFSLAVFYLAPVALATWYAGRAIGWLIALLSAAGWLIADLALSHLYGHPLIPYWNAAMLALIYGVVVQLLAAFRSVQTELEERVAQRTASLAKANAELEVAMMRFIEVDKLESIGRLAAGVAHEVKNPLMTIAMVADYLAEVIPPTESDRASMIHDLHDAVERANRVISEMLEFARPGALSLQPEDFHVVAELSLIHI